MTQNTDSGYCSKFHVPVWKEFHEIFVTMEQRKSQIKTHFRFNGWDIREEATIRWGTSVIRLRCRLMTVLPFFWGGGKSVDFHVNIFQRKSRCLFVCSKSFTSSHKAVRSDIDKGNEWLQGQLMMAQPNKALDLQYHSNTSPQHTNTVTKVYTCSIIPQ